MIYNFRSIFSGTVKKIIIPNIQRDYAQGRKNPKVDRIRQNFLNSLYDAVNGKKIKLDFVYGDLDDEEVLTPLDGQQRLTTLFLLYWYASKKEHVEENFLQNFSYETRPDSRQFCKKLITFSPNFNQEILSEEIADQAWFPLNWKKDPTISAMLVMIDDIHEKFNGVENLLANLSNIEFYFLPVKDLELNDEIYITMNSRGKLLTDFEHFKAEFKRRLDKFDSKCAEDLISKIDTTWTDMLWKISVKNKSYLVDNYFLNYFKFLCDLEVYQNGGIPKKDRNFFVLLDEFFSGDVKRKIENLKENFNCWCDCEDTYKFFGDRVLIGSKSEKTYQHEAGKFVGFFQMKEGGNFFADCLKSYDGKLGKFIMLFAFLTYRRNRKNIEDWDFRRRIRIVNNLISNSEFEIREQIMNPLLAQVENIIKIGKFLNLDKGRIFNDAQIQEEKLKLEWTENNPALAESLFALEDHPLLYGQIGIVGLENPNNFESFISLFKCNYDLIDRVLLIIGDYYQHNLNQVYQFGSEFNLSWQNLFHVNKNNIGYQETKECLNILLAMSKKFDNTFLEKIIVKYINSCEMIKSFEWKYYYIRYNIFRPAYGKYFWANFKNEPYLFTAYKTKDRISEKAYPPFLRAIMSEEISTLSEETFYDKYVCITEPRLNAKCSYLEFGKFKIFCENDAYTIEDNEDKEFNRRVEINQINGVDTEDRIEKFLNYLLMENIV